MVTMAKDGFLQQEMIKLWTWVFYRLGLISLLCGWQANWLTLVSDSLSVKWR